MESRKMDMLMDLAASEAVGANSAADTAAYQQELSEAGMEGARVDRSLRELAGRLGAASPHIAPPADLRGKLLQATAPVTFRMEEYRKAMKEPSRFYRWGFVAAMLFLSAAAYYNLSMQSTLKAVTQEANARLNAQSQVLGQVIDPATTPIALVQDGKMAAKAYVDWRSHRAVLVVPVGTSSKLAKGDSLRLMLTPPNGKPEEFETVLVEASPELFQGKPPTQLDRTVVVQGLTPVEPQKSYQAGFGSQE